MHPTIKKKKSSFSLIPLIEIQNHFSETVKVLLLNLHDLVC